MDIIKAIKARASTRAFLCQDVDDNIIEQILAAARWAPSGTNTQPWSVAVVQGETKSAVTHAVTQAFDNGTPGHQDYDYYPREKLPEPFKSRRFACGMALYDALGVQREDKERRKAVWRLNYQAFSAPVILFFFIDKFLKEGSWLDYGMFLQNIMLAALDFDLATCPQAALAEYPDIVRAHLGPEYQDKILVAGMALGYPDETDPVNQYRTEREAVANL